VFEKPHWLGLNAGIFLMRNCQWSFDLMDALMEIGEKGIVRNSSAFILNDFVAGREQASDGTLELSYTQWNRDLRANSQTHVLSCSWTLTLFAFEQRGPRQEKRTAWQDKEKVRSQHCVGASSGCFFVSSPPFSSFRWATIHRVLLCSF
jgi:hypothetical protein